VNGGEMDPDMAALIDQADDGPRVPAPEPTESIIDKARREADWRDAARFTALSEPSPFEHRVPPPERPALKPRPQPRIALDLGGRWQLYGKIGNLPHPIAGANLVSAWGVFATARTGYRTCTDEQERPAALDAFVDAGDEMYRHLGQAFADVPTEEQAAFFEAWWHTRTADSADMWMDLWEKWRRQQRALASQPAPRAIAPPSAPPTIRPPTTRLVQRQIDRTTPREAPPKVAPASNDERIAALFLKRLGQREIARRVGVSQKTVSRRIIAMRLTYE